MNFVTPSRCLVVLFSFLTLVGMGQTSHQSQWQSLDDNFSSSLTISKKEKKAWDESYRALKEDYLDAPDVNRRVKILCNLSQSRKDPLLHAQPILHIVGNVTRTPENISSNRNLQLTRYDGFNKFLERDGFHAFLHENSSNKSLLIQWRKLNNSSKKDIEDLLKFLSGNKMLSHNLIVDMRYCEGNTLVPEIINYLFEKKINYGQLEVSAIGQKYLEAEIQPKLSKALSNTKPQKNHAKSVSIDAMLTPSTQSTFFKGNIVILMGPESSKGTEYLLSVVADNNLAHTIGSSTLGRGYWDIQDQEVEVEKGKFIKFPMPVSQLIRPNGSPIEGNPIHPKKSIADVNNTEVLLSKALQYFNRKS